MGYDDHAAKSSHTDWQAANTIGTGFNTIFQDALKWLRNTENGLKMIKCHK